MVQWLWLPWTMHVFSSSSRSQTQAHWPHKEAEEVGVGVEEEMEEDLWKLHRRYWEVKMPVSRLSR